MFKDTKKKNAEQAVKPVSISNSPNNEEKVLSVSKANENTKSQSMTIQKDPMNNSFTLNGKDFFYSFENWL